MDTMMGTYMSALTSLGPIALQAPGKPGNTRTRKTVWKELRRRANLPKTMRRRLAKRNCSS